MTNKIYWSINWIAFKTIAAREIRRFVRYWLHTLLPPVINTFLYFVVFGVFLGKHVIMKNHLTYNQFIFPGLVMMAVIYNAYLSVSSSFNLAKAFKYIEEIIVSPVYPITIIFGYAVGGVIRGLLVAILVSLISVIFVPINISHPLLMVLVIFLISLIFSLIGLINGILARKFEDINIVLIFIVTPLTFLGGVFYSLEQLPSEWRWICYANPITYIVNAFRFTFYNVSELPFISTIIVSITLLVFLTYISINLLYVKLYSK